LHVVAGNGQKILPGKDGYIGGKAKKKKNKKMEKVKGKEECK